jgi:hypothetical protein
MTCRRGLACTVCRTRAIAYIREAAGREIGLSGDFDCPYGVPWREAGEPIPPHMLQGAAFKRGGCCGE